MMNRPSCEVVLKCVLLSVLGGIAVQRARGQTIDAGIPVKECIVRFANEVRIPALESGRIAEIHVKTNEYITKGQPIGRLDDQLLISRRASAGVRLDAAKDEANSDVELRYAEVALKEAQDELNRNKTVEAGLAGAIARQRMIQLRLAHERAQLEVALAKQRSGKAMSEVKIQQAEVSMLDDQLRSLRCFSPIEGVVLEMKRSAGEWIERGETIATVAQIDRLHVRALVDAKQISPVQCNGLPVTVKWVDPRTGVKRVLYGNVLSVDPKRLPGDQLKLHAEVNNQTEPQDRSLWQLNPGTEVQMMVHPRQSRRTASASSKDSNR